MLASCLQGDISAGKMIFGVEGVDPARRAELVAMLDIDLYQASPWGLVKHTKFDQVMVAA